MSIIKSVNKPPFFFLYHMPLLYYYMALIYRRKKISIFFPYNNIYVCGYYPAFVNSINYYCMGILFIEMSRRALLLNIVYYSEKRGFRIIGAHARHVKLSVQFCILNNNDDNVLQNGRKWSEKRGKHLGQWVSRAPVTWRAGRVTCSLPTRPAAFLLWLFPIIFFFYLSLFLSTLVI